MAGKGLFCFFLDEAHMKVLTITVLPKTLYKVFNNGKVNEILTRKILIVNII